VLISESDLSGAAGELNNTPGRWITGVTADQPLLDALEIVFTQRLQGIFHYLPLAAEKSARNASFVHRLRVSCRRLGAVLDILGEVLPAAPRKALLKVVDEIRRSCGHARNLDVRRKHLESLLKSASIEDVGVLEFMRQTIVRRRKEVQRRLRRKLPRLHKHLTGAGAELLTAIGCLQGTAAAREFGSFGRTGCRILTQELDAIWKTAASEPDSTQRLHQLRIACKHLRYAVEIFMPALPEVFRDDFYPQLENIQELLGEFHDAAEATVAFKRIKKKFKKWRGTRKWNSHGLQGFHWREVRSGLDWVLLAYAQQSDHARTEFFDLWPGFAGASFREPVAELLAAQFATESSEPVQDANRGPAPGENDEHLLPH